MYFKFFYSNVWKGFPVSVHSECPAEQDKRVGQVRKSLKTKDDICLFHVLGLSAFSLIK